MHEMSIALSIVDIASDICHKEQKSFATKIGLEIGQLSGIQYEALEFVWPLAVEGTVLERAETEIIKIKGEATCLECGHHFMVQHHFDNCPNCQSFLKEVTKGKELKVKYLEV